MSNGKKGIKKDIYKMKYKAIFAMALIYALLFTTCSNLFESSASPDSVKPGYGIIRISTDNETMRTSFPSITPFERYEYTFTKVTADSELIGEAETIEPVDGVFTLAVGYYTVSINAFIAEDNVYPAANGVSAIFQINPGSNETLVVPLAFITDFEDAAQGTFIYIIKYPLGANVDSFTLRKWAGTETEPAYTDVIINYEPLAEENGITQTVQLEAGFYLLNIRVVVDGKYAGTVETVHIYPASTTLVEIIFDREGLVTTAVYGIELSEYDNPLTGTHIFGSVNYGYTTQEPLTVSVSNIGNQITGELSVTLSDIDSFALSTESLSSIAVDGTDVFTILPNTGLSSGTYTATVTVSGNNGIQGSFGICITINPAPLTITGFDVTKIYDGTDAVTNFGSPTFNGLQFDEIAGVDTAGVTAVYAQETVGTGINIVYTDTFVMADDSTANPSNYEIIPPTLIGAITLASPQAPASPTLDSKTHNSITLKEPAGANQLFLLEYGISTENNTTNATWQKELFFDELVIGAAYYFFARYQADPDRNNASAASPSLAITTLQTISSSSPDWIAYYWVDEHDSLIINDGVSFTIHPGDELEITALDGESGYTVLRWYVNGTLIDHDRNSYLFSSVEPGAHNVGLVVVKDGKYYNTNISITVLGN